MKRSCQIFITLFVLLSVGRANALEKYAGDWKMISMKFQVSVVSWGDHCGPKPSSYQSNQHVSVKITSKGNHLVFSKGGLRTDRCGSPNPRLQTISATASDGKWIRVCKTDTTDSKYEWGKYTVIAKSEDRLEYTAESKFDWTLKDDHCIANSKERRVYVRVNTGGDVEEPPKPPVELPPLIEEPVVPGCENPGPPKRINVEPKRMELGPSERECFRVIAVDAQGCKQAVRPKWTVSQGGQPVRGLVTPGGCFVAGDTAADSEGLYRVVAKYKGKTDASEVFVAFPDIAELLAARLRPLEELTPENPTDSEPSPNGQVDTSESPAKPGVPVLPAKAPSILIEKGAQESGDSNTKWVLFIIFGIIVVASVAIAIVILRKRSSVNEQDDGEFDDWLGNVDRVSGYDDPLLNPSNTGSSPNVLAREKKTCPECQRNFSMDASFCPEDGSTLLVVKSATGSGPRSSQIVVEDGKICPQCHRGYDMAAGFCPHDSERLVPYSEWRSKKR